MDLRHVRAFIAVAEASSVTRAAERLHVSQPPLSRSLHQLEEELGVSLFLRHRHGVSLTESGRQLLEKARLLDAAAVEFRSVAQRLRSAVASEIRIGIGWGLWDVVNRVRVAFAESDADVAVSGTDAPCWYDSDEQLRAGALDVAFARPPFDPAFESRLVLREPIQVILADANPLAAREALDIRDLAGEPLLLWDRHVVPSLYDQILELYARAGIEPRTIPTPGAGPFNHAGVMHVASGKGIYLGYGVPLTDPKPASGVAVRPLTGPGTTIEVRVVYRRGKPSPAIQRFLACVDRIFPSGRALAAEGARVASRRARPAALRSQPSWTPPGEQPYSD